MSDFYDEADRFGSARWAVDEYVPKMAGRTGQRLYHGVAAQGGVLSNPFDAPALLVGGAGSGKTASVLMYNACTYKGPMLIADFKGEIGKVSEVALAHLRKPGYFVNPARLLDLPNHSVDPLDILRADSPSLVPDAKMIAEMLVPLSGSGAAQYFEEKARLLVEAVMIADAELHGVASLRRVYRAINAIDGDAEAWSAMLENMLTSAHEHVRSMAGEAIFKQKEVAKEWSGIVGEAKKSLSFLDGPMFEGSEKPDFSLSVLTEKRCNVYINIPVEYLSIWSPFLRLVIGVAMLYKQRKPQAERVVYLIDEAAQLGVGPSFLLRSLTFGRGCGIQSFVAYQSFGQLKAQFGHDGAQTAMSCCPLTQVFGIRDYETAEAVSRRLGAQSLAYDAELEQAAARRNKAHIVRELMEGADPVKAGLNYAQQARAAVNRQKIGRPLLTPDECLRLPEDRQIIFTSGIDCPPIAAFKRPYWLHRELAGKWLPNPYHGGDSVSIPGFWRTKKCRVITEPVPECFADYPQYQDGLISYVEGYRPF